MLPWPWRSRDRGRDPIMVMATVTPTRSMCRVPRSYRGPDYHRRVGPHTIVLDLAATMEPSWLAVASRVRRIEGEKEEKKREENKT